MGCDASARIFFGVVVYDPNNYTDDFQLEVDYYEVGEFLPEGLEMIMHGYTDGEAIWTLCVKDVGKWVCDYGYEAFDPSSLVVPEGAVEKLKAVCEKFNLKWSDPKWIIAASYG